MSWEWILRADGQVFYRLAKVDGKRERNVDPSDAAASSRAGRRPGDQNKAAAALDAIVRQHGHRR